MGPRSPAYGSSPDSGSGRAAGARNRSQRSPQKHITDFETDSLATRDLRVDRIRQFSYIFRSVRFVSLEERLVEDGC